MRIGADIDIRVAVRRDWLLETVKKNREEHHDVFTKAFERYRTALLEHVESNLEEFRDNPRAVQFKYFTGVRPEDHTADYDVVIAMLEKTEEPSITLTGSDFRRFVQDEWDWTAQFVNFSNAYGVSTKFDERIPDGV